VVASLGDSLDLPKVDAEIASLEEQQNADGFWNDQKKAKTVTSRLAYLTNKKNALKKIQSDYQDIEGMLPEVSEGDKDMLELLTSMEEDLEKACSTLRHQLLFSGEYDGLNCTLEIHPGAGGTEAQDWASMLLRMYRRFAERNGFKCQVLDYEEGEEAGLKSATIKLIGPDAYGMLKSEKGVHRLVRISPFDAAARRHTSFASVNVTPEFGAVSDVVIDPKDLRVDTYRSGGAGGQNVNKVSSAVRITHIPTNIVVAIQNERSQLQNKEKAMEILRGKLQQMMQEQNAESVDKLRAGESASWGQQIRNYVLHPYKLVKDTRTKYEENDAEAVLDGNIDGFITSFLDNC
jgi:peptide chain release factor 2